MRKFSCAALAIALSAVVVYICSCALGGGLIDPKDPIFPLPDLKEGVVDPRTRAITITKDGLTVTVEHWSRTRLNRKYTTVDMRSAFYYQEGWPDGFKSEAFYVTIKNDTPTNAIVSFNETTIEDDFEYKYKPLKISDFEYKFVTRKMMDLRTKNGLRKAREIMLDEVLGRDKVVPPGQTRSGFLGFTILSSRSTKVWITLVMERAPEVAIKAYERVEFRFDFAQDPALRARQPAVKR